MHSLSTWIVIRRLRIPILVIIITFSISILGMVLIPGQDDQGNVYHLSFFDAFYFVSYMASTIGFGESPYDFTYPQKLWVSFNVYMTVIGWFYGIGAIVSLMQDKTLHKEMDRSKFAKSVQAIKGPFVLIFGYNNATKRLIRKFSQTDMQMVLVDKDEKAIEELQLENYTPYIPTYAGDAVSAELLEMAGIRKKNCEYVISLFDDEHKNTKIALMVRHLNKHVKLALRSDSLQNSEFLETIGADFVENPFKIISNRLYLSLRSPHIWLLEMWILGHVGKLKTREQVPDGRFVIYGNGRMAEAMEEGLRKANVRYDIIDAKVPHANDYSEDVALCHEDQIENKLMDADIQSASAIIAATRDDFVNLAAITVAKKLNPKIYTITRENEFPDARLFKLARINRHYLLEDILINKTYHYMLMPLAHKFVDLIHEKEDEWGRRLVNRIVEKMGKEPELFEISINQNEAYAVCEELKSGGKVKIEYLKKKRDDYTKVNAFVFLLVLRDEEIILLPEDDFEIRLEDKLLLVGKGEGRIDLEYILENYYELHYVMHNREKKPGLLGIFS